MSLPDPFLERPVPRPWLASPRPHGTPKMRLVSTLEAIITDSIMSHGRAAILTLGTEPQMFWLDRRRGSESDPVTRDELLAFATRSWRPAGALHSLLRHYVSDQFLMSGERIGHVNVLPSLACLAHHWCRLLITQLGAGDDVATTQPPARTTRACFATLTNSRQISLAFGDAIRGTIAAIELQARALAADAKPSMVRFELRDGIPTASWLAEDGMELAHEPLGSLMGRVRDSSRPDPHLRQIEKLQAEQRAYVDAAKELLDASCPELAKANEFACSSRRLTCFTLCPRLSVHGLPAQVCLYLDPTGAYPGPTVTLVARRAQEEFVLENPNGVLLYFPPVQLEAQILFQAAHETWQIANPRVRMPKGGPLFTHPYAGGLAPDRLAGAHTIIPGGPEPMAEMSAAGRRLLPHTAGHYDLPASNDLCLTGQQRTVERIGEGIRRAETAGRDPHLAAAVLSLWNIASLGLTHGHTNNRDTPRVDLNRTESYYPVRRPRDLIGSPLAECIFPYNPSRPVVL